MFANKNLLTNKDLNAASKLQIYKTIIRPTVTYGCETWAMTFTELNHLLVFERRILRKIYGPTLDSGGTWRIKTNEELEMLIKKKIYCNIYKITKITVKKLTEWEPCSSRPVGRPRLRWLDQVEEDLKKMKVRNWREREREREKFKDRRLWNKIVKQAKTHQGL